MNYILKSLTLSGAPVNGSQMIKIEIGIEGDSFNLCKFETIPVELDWAKTIQENEDNLREEAINFINNKYNEAE